MVLDYETVEVGAKAANVFNEDTKTDNRFYYCA